LRPERFRVEEYTDPVSQEDIVHTDRLSEISERFGAVLCARMRRTNSASKFAVLAELVIRIVTLESPEPV
jgi:hypothetical protein